MRQWMMRITAYADRLIADLDLLDWTDAIKAMQRNWIGRSEGATVHFQSTAGPISVFTTRPDTLFGATFMVLAPEHPLVDALTTPGPSPGRRRNTATRRRRRRTSTARTTPARRPGSPTGAYAINPVNGESIPIWIADYVLMGYGTGAIMAVPCGDQRDFEFARLYGLPILPIQQPPDRSLDTSTWEDAFVGDAPYVNSSNGSLDLNGITSVAEAKRLTNEWLEANGHGRSSRHLQAARLAVQPSALLGRAVPHRLRRRRQPARVCPTSELPLVLPETDSFSPRTFDPDDEFSEPGEPARPARVVDQRRARSRRRSAAVPPRHQRDAAVGRQLLVRAALPRPDQRADASSTPRSSGTGWARSPRATTGTSTPAASTSTWAASSMRCCTCCTPASGTRCCSTSAMCRRRSRTTGCSTRATSSPRRTRTSARSTSRPPRSSSATAPTSTTTSRSPASGARWARA